MTNLSVIAAEELQCDQGVGFLPVHQSSYRVNHKKVSSHLVNKLGKGKVCSEAPLHLRLSKTCAYDRLLESTNLKRLFKCISGCCSMENLHI